MIRLASALLAPVLALALMAPAHADGPRVALLDGPDAQTEPLRHVVHGELVTGIVTNAVTINYEHLLGEHVALRVGYGSSIVFAMTQVKKAHGPLAMLAFFVGDESKLEVALGASIVTASHDAPFDGHLGGSWWAVPNFEIGYRYQPRDGGLVVRAGFALSSAFGAPFTLGVGYAF
ncbi:MAG: hypothetical protein IT385_03430 [Deltaproteobacteria bacterium]|nr:hypothetical protein [Deltaproteobacteria bacterium]